MKSNSNFEKLAFLLIIFGVILFASSICLFSWNQRLFLSTSQVNSELLSHFGHFIEGTVGSMWGLSSILLFYLTLKNQKEEIAKNQSESILRMGQLAKQNDQFRQERTESMIFQLLASHHSLIQSIEISVYDRDSKTILRHGRECFIPMFKIYKDEYYNKSVEQDTRKKIDQSFKLFFEKYQEWLGNYFRNLYNIFKYIDNSNLEDHLKVQYTRIIRAQLSNYELLLLFYNCMSEYGVKFNKYAIKYQLFDNLIRSYLIDKQHAELITVVSHEDSKTT